MLEKSKKAAIFYHQSIDAYHFGPGISKTGLCKLDEAPAVYEHCYLSGNHKSESSSKSLGKIFHALMDESFSAEYSVVSDSLRRNTKAWAAEEEKNRGKTLVKQKDVETSLNMAKAVKKFGPSKDLLKDGHYEVSYYWKDPVTGLLCKCRPDFINGSQTTVVDFKSARRVGPKVFRWDAFSYHYYVSAAFTLQGVEAVTGIRPQRYIFLVVCSDAPHLVAAYEATHDEIELGNKFISKNLLTLKECNDEAQWPGLAEEVLPLGLPYQGIQELEEYQRIEHEFSYLIG